MYVIQYARQTKDGGHIWPYPSLWATFGRPNYNFYLFIIFHDILPMSNFPTGGFRNDSTSTFASGNTRGLRRTCGWWRFHNATGPSTWPFFPLRPIAGDWVSARSGFRALLRRGATLAGCGRTS